MTLDTRPVCRPLLWAAFLVLFWFAGAAIAASPLTVGLSSEASQPADNDLMQATLYAEVTGASPGENAARLNPLIAEAIKLAKTYPDVKVQSGGTSAYPVYAKEGVIESWRMRTSLNLESGDAAGLSELIGKLQATLAVSSLRLQPSRETRRKAEDAAILDALAQFKARAKLIADAQGKGYAIKELTISTGGRFYPIAPTPRAAKALSATPAPLPIESGETQVTATVSGKIEIE
jgi:predicted secreted protein